MSQPEVEVRVVYDGRWFLVDIPVEIDFDGEPVGDGSCINGFDIDIDTRVGEHDLELRVAFRKQLYELTFPKPGAYEVTISYSRMWGNFSSKCEVEYLG